MIKRKTIENVSANEGELETLTATLIYNVDDSKNKRTFTVWKNGEPISHRGISLTLSTPYTPVYRYRIFDNKIEDSVLSEPIYVNERIIEIKQDLTQEQMDVLSAKFRKNIEKIIGSNNSYA